MNLRNDIVFFGTLAVVLHYSFDCGIAIILVIVTIRTRRESLLALWLLVPIVLFSVAWEPQHWFMLTVLLIAHRLRLTHPTSPAPATGDGSRDLTSLGVESENV
jgi:hypothetical protein